MTKTPKPEPVEEQSAEPTLTSADFDAWLAGTSLSETSVEIMQNPALLAKYEDWQRRWIRSEKLAATIERSAADKDPLAALETEGEQLLDDIQKATSTWYLRGLTDDEAQAIIDAYPEPPKPALYEEDPPLPIRNGSNAQAEAYVKGFEAWQIRRDHFNAIHAEEQDAWARAAAKCLEDRGAERIARAVVRIEQNGRTVATSITAVQARALPGTIGEKQVEKICDAITRATRTAPEIPDSFLSPNSAKDPTWSDT
jgi:hypothetical protein